MQTKIQIDHHQEQMEAMRQDFGKLWEGEIISQLRALRVEAKDLPIIEHACWTAFRKAKQPR